MWITSAAVILNAWVATYPACPSIPISVAPVNTAAYVSIDAIRYDQTSRDGVGQLILTNASGQDVDGVYIQVEWLSPSQELLGTGGAFAELGATAGQGRYRFTSLRPPLEPTNWQQPLHVGERRVLHTSHSLVLAQCPSTARVRLFAIKYSGSSWQLVKGDVVRETTFPRHFDEESIVIEGLEPTIRRHGDVVLNVLVSESGDAELKSTHPELALPERQIAAQFVRRWSFYPAMRNGKVTTENLLVVLRCGKERYEAPLPALPADMSGPPALVLGISTVGVHSRFVRPSYGRYGSHHDQGQIRTPSRPQLEMGRRGR
jgi:hypothetical protein